MNKSGILPDVLLLVMLMFSAGSLMAQEEEALRDQQVQAQNSATTAFGTIDTVMQDDGYIVVDGKRLVYRDSQVSITYKDRQMRSSFLGEGIRISYNTQSDGSISSITLLGPVEVLEQIDSQ